MAPATAGPARAGGPSRQAGPVSDEVISTLQLAATRFAEQIEEMTKAQMKLLQEQLAKLSGETRETVRRELTQWLELSKAKLREQTEAQLGQSAKQLEEMRQRAVASALEGFQKVSAALERASPGKPGKPDPGKP
jgi:FAD/FMN-containing dehydrogenase